MRAPVQPPPLRVEDLLLSRLVGLLCCVVDVQTDDGEVFAEEGDGVEGQRFERWRQVGVGRGLEEGLDEGYAGKDGQCALLQRDGTLASRSSITSFSPLVESNAEGYGRFLPDVFASFSHNQGRVTKDSLG